LINWLDQWQTLISGTGAIIAASVTAFLFWKQLRSDKVLEEGRRRRRLAATRSRLQLALSNATQYANDALTLLKAYLDAVVSGGDTEALANEPRPTLPEAAILAFETMIEATDDEKFSALIADAVSQMQVMNSRLRGIHSDAGVLGARNVHAYLLNAARIYGFCSAAFPFARREIEDPPQSIDWQSARTGLRLRGMYEEEYAELHAFVQRAAERSQHLDGRREASRGFSLKDFSG
jgi:hypothetical protein